MSAIDKIKELIVRLVRDESFFSDLTQQSTPEEQAEFLTKSGYGFSPTEFDSAAIKILELAEKGDFTDLNEDELVAVFGGQTNNLVQPLYGVSIGPIDNPVLDNPILPALPAPKPKPRRYWGWWWKVRNPRQPIAGKPPEAVALYGVAIPPSNTNSIQ
jgi:hypothetical protein